MPWAAALAIGGSSLVSGMMGKSSAKKTAGAIRESTREQQRQFNLARDDTLPYRQIGEEAIYSLSDIFGLPNTRLNDLQTEYEKTKNLMDFTGDFWDEATMGARGSMGEADRTQAWIGMRDAKLRDLEQRIAREKERQANPLSMTDRLQQTPGYQFRLGEGQKALDRIQAAKRLTGGRAIKEAVRYNQDYASNEFDKDVARRFTLAGFGPAGVNTSANAGMTLGGQVGNAAIQAAGASAAGDQAMSNAIQGGISNYMTMNMYNDMLKRLPSQTTQSQAPQTYTT